MNTPDDTLDAAQPPAPATAAAPKAAAKPVKASKAIVQPKAAASSAADKAPARVKAAKKAAPATPPVVARKAANRPAKTAAAAAAGRKTVKTKNKLVRDSFTMPQADFDLIDVLKQRAMNFRHAAKKGELLRAGLQVLAALPDAQLQVALARITPLKTGRPKKAD